MRPKTRDRDRGRGQGPEAEARALRSRPRPRPISWLRGQAEAKDKVINKKCQMMVDNTRANLYHCDQNDSLISHSLSHSNLSSVTVWCPVVGKQIGQSISSWLLVLLLQTEARLRPNFWGQGRGEAKALRPRPRPRPKFWPRGQWPRGLNISDIMMPIANHTVCSTISAK